MGLLRCIKNLNPRYSFIWINWPNVMWCNTNKLTTRKSSPLWSWIFFSKLHEHWHTKKKILERHLVYCNEKLNQVNTSEERPKSARPCGSKNSSDGVDFEVWKCIIFRQNIIKCIIREIRLQLFHCHFFRIKDFWNLTLYLGSKEVS